MIKPVVWTIAGSDSGGGAGIQADLHTFHALGVHGCSVIVALTAQNSKQVKHIEFSSPDMIRTQISALLEDLPPQAVKMGMLGSLTTLQTMMPFLAALPVPIVYDPVLFASVGDALYAGNVRDYLLQYILPKVTLLTPNLPEAEWLLQTKINSNAEMEQAAQRLLALGPQSVLIKGGHAASQMRYSQDYWTDGQQAFWLSSERLSVMHRHGSGCTLSSAITACLAQDYSMADALVIAKAYVNQGIRLAVPIGAGPGPIAHGGWPMEGKDIPYLTEHSVVNEEAAFLDCGEEPLGFYPIVDSWAWVEKLIRAGVRTIQLRVKDGQSSHSQEPLLKNTSAFASPLVGEADAVRRRVRGGTRRNTPHPDPLPQGERESSHEGSVTECSTPHPDPLPQGEREDEKRHLIALAKQQGVRLFINDDWRLALAEGAYGVHLGQSDLVDVDWHALRQAGIRVGISTYSYADFARARAIRPSYVGIGPVYPTTSKQINKPPVGLERLRQYCQLLDCPVVAIGGINWERLPGVLATGIAGVAVISAVTKAEDPLGEVRRWKKMIGDAYR
ncbi:MAG TPA: bifunctional hydroxymethylpyrimidine kinase/phosphomethylpyrimidine kinase [Gammaproteobacteria bacterium]|nr:bifunctional hydroxymethylpyrimidine kinase/phosphomethylpyrimidine kinase [Gammaproteobacteria bacterium]